MKQASKAARAERMDIQGSLTRDKQMGDLASANMKVAVDVSDQLYDPAKHHCLTGSTTVFAGCFLTPMFLAAWQFI